MSKRTFVNANLLLAMILLVAIAGPTLGQRVRSSNQLTQQTKSDAADVIFRSGRDLITDQEWAKAQEKFNQLIATYPNDKNVDAAMYWMAYAMNKQSKTDQCRQTLAQLLEKYPNTSWREDARLLLAQTLAGHYVYEATPTPGFSIIEGVGSGTGVGIGRAPVAIAAPSGNATIWALEPDDDAAGDDPCEFKIVVLQALFQTDVQRGVVAATEWLKPGSTQTVRCKGAALSLLGRFGGKAVTPVIIGVARNESDLKLRARAISALGVTNDDSVIDALREFALNAKENDIIEASLYALSKHTGERAIPVLVELASSSNRPTPLRKIAIASIATRPGEPAVDALLRIYDADQTPEIRRTLIAGFGNRRSERAGAKLLEIARSSDVIELRKAAISALSRRSGESAIDNLLSLYDSEKNEEVKDQIMNAFGSGTVIYASASTAPGMTTIAPGNLSSRSRLNDQRVVTKLIEIARNPQTPMERRKRAIGWLSRSNDPKVLQFLEELLK
jgi:HEAT repeat protein/tetratricopeptide repeat protein